MAETNETSKEKQQAKNIEPTKEYTIGGTTYKIDQETTNQLVLDEVAAAQTRLNMAEAEEADKRLKTAFTTEGIRQATADSDLRRLEMGTVGEQDRLTQRVSGEERRLATQVEGEESRLTATTVGEQTRLTEAEKGLQERYTQKEGLVESGRQQRQTQAEKKVGETANV